MAAAIESTVCSREEISTEIDSERERPARLGVQPRREYADDATTASTKTPRLASIDALRQSCAQARNLRAPSLATSARHGRRPALVDPRDAQSSPRRALFLRARADRTAVPSSAGTLPDKNHVFTITRHKQRSDARDAEHRKSQRRRSSDVTTSGLLSRRVCASIIAQGQQRAQPGARSEQMQDVGGQMDARRTARLRSPLRDPPMPTRR